jgi:hypothetical protein
MACEDSSQKCFVHASYRRAVLFRAIPEDSRPAALREAKNACSGNKKFLPENR